MPHQCCEYLPSRTNHCDAPVSSVGCMRSSRYIMVELTRSCQCRDVHIRARPPALVHALERDAASQDEDDPARLLPQHHRESSAAVRISSRTPSHIALRHLQLLVGPYLAWLGFVIAILVVRGITSIHSRLWQTVLIPDNRSERCIRTLSRARVTSCTAPSRAARRECPPHLSALFRPCRCI